MKNGYKLGLAAIAASISLVGCGSDSTTAETVTGQFVDTYVAGLNYTCSSGTTGITNNMGEYTCNVDDTVEFSLGSYVLGSATASSGIVTPETLYPDNPEAALNVAQVIQSLDTDPTDDIITIPENFTDLDEVNVTVEDENFDASIEDVLDVPLVTEEDAQAHLDETELMLLLAGKTFYNVGETWLDELVFNADLTSAVWTQLVGDGIGETATDTLRVEGEKLYINEEFYAVLAEETNDYILMDNFALDGTFDGQSRLYFDEATAKAYFEGYILITEEKLSGKTFYEMEVEYDDWNNPATPTGYLYASMTFSNGTFTRSEIWVNATNPDDTESWDFPLPYVLIDGKVRIDVSTVPDQDPQDPEGFIWITLDMESETEWIIVLEKDNDKDGIIDPDSFRESTWYLSKPDGYPDSL